MAYDKQVIRWLTVRYDFYPTSGRYDITHSPATSQPSIICVWLRNDTRSFHVFRGFICNLHVFRGFDLDWKLSWPQYNYRSNYRSNYRLNLWLPSRGTENIQLKSVFNYKLSSVKAKNSWTTERDFYFINYYTFQVYVKNSAK